MFGGFLKAAVYSLPISYFPIDKSAMPTRIDITSSGSDAAIVLVTYDFHSSGVLVERRFSKIGESFREEHALDGNSRVIRTGYAYGGEDSARVVDTYEYGSDGILKISRPFLSSDFFYKDHKLDSLRRVNTFDDETYSWKFEYDDSQRVVKSGFLLLPEGNTETTAIEYFLPDSIVRKRKWRYPLFQEEDSSTSVLYLKNGLLVKRVVCGSSQGIPDTSTAIFTYAAPAGLVRKGARRKEILQYSPEWMRYDIAGRQRKAHR